MHTALENRLGRLYWATRIGICCIWLWTAISSWFFFPHAQSVAWLLRLGLTAQPDLWFDAACVTDLAMGIASAALASRLLWQMQIVLVAFYSVAIAFALPEFLFHPFGPLTKNIAVIACLAYLTIMESGRVKTLTSRRPLPQNRT